MFIGIGVDGCGNLYACGWIAEICTRIFGAQVIDLFVLYVFPHQKITTIFEMVDMSMKPRRAIAMLLVQALAQLDLNETYKEYLFGLIKRLESNFNQF